MQKSFWIERWLNKQTGFHQQEINRYLTDHWQQLGIAAGATVFVPLCGKTSDIIWLAQQGYQVVGVELSEVAVQEFFAENHLVAEITDVGAFRCFSTQNIRIFQGDYFSLDSTLLGHIDAVFDRAALIALPVEMRPDYVRHLLAISGHAPILLISMEYDQAEMQGPPFSVPLAELKDLFSAGARNVTVLLTVDLVVSEPRFKQKGVSRLNEIVCHIR